jgi:hypothetical protein
MSTPQRTVTALITLATSVALSAAQPVQAACYGPGQQLPAQVVSRSMNDPEQLLTQFPSGGRQMISLIRDLVASEPGALPLILDLSAKANSEQIQAIGTGLGQAARVCSRTAPAFANEIQQMTVATNVQPVTQGFAAVTGDLFPGSVGLVRDAGGGGGGGGTVQNGPTGTAAASGPPSGLTTSVPTATSNFLALSLSSPPGAPGSGSSGLPSGLNLPVITNSLVAPVMNSIVAPFAANSVVAPLTANSIVAPVTTNSVVAPLVTNNVISPLTANSVVARGINISRSTSPSRP